jgi:hypothetical protein
MTDLRLRDELERESHRISLHPGAAERMFERRDRRDRRRRTATAVVGLALAAGVVALVLTSLPGRNGDRDVVSGRSAIPGSPREIPPSRGSASMGGSASGSARTACSS